MTNGILAQYQWPYLSLSIRYRTDCCSVSSRHMASTEGVKCLLIKNDLYGRMKRVKVRDDALLD